MHRYGRLHPLPFVKAAASVARADLALEIYYGDGRHLIAVTMHDADKIAQV